MKTNSYNFDAITNTLTITKDFARKASQLNSAEYITLLQLRKDYPTLQIIMREGKKGQPSNNIGFAQMKAFIKQCRDAESRLATYERVKALSKVQRFPYGYVKDWFLTNYANYADDPVFDADGFVIVRTKAQLVQEAEGAAASEGAARGGTVSDPAVSAKADNKADEVDEDGRIVTTFVEESEKANTCGDTNSGEATAALAA